METIHLKTVDPLSQEILRRAARAGLALGWERLERLQPQDGFLRLGLSCPLGCLQGPCRIDPFGRGAQAGLCGLDRDGMVAALILRLTLSGALEAAGGAAREETLSDDLSKLAAAQLGQLGGPVGAADIFTAASLLNRPDLPAGDLIHQALRLGVLALGFLDRTGFPAKTAEVGAGYGLLAGAGPIVGVLGRPSAELIDRLLAAAGSEVKVVALGSWVAKAGGFLPLAGTSGEAELLVASGRVGAFLAGPGADPGLPALAQKLGRPVIRAGEASAEEVVQAARKSPRTDSGLDFSSAPAGRGTLFSCAIKLREELSGTPDRTVALLAGDDDPRLPLGHLATTLSPALQAEGFRTAAKGDAAAWLLKAGQGESNLLVNPVRGAVALLKALGSPRRLKVAYVGLKGLADLAEALGLAALGVKVALALPLPLWGSEATRRALGDRISGLGGELTHFDHPAGADRLLAWFKKD